jgi:alanine dehydrogenase
MSRVRTDSFSASAVAFLTDSEVRERLDFAELVGEIEAAHVALARGGARLFTIVRESLAGGAVFGIKSGSWLDRGLLGLKQGGYWSGNKALGMPRHQAVVCLFDPTTGRLDAVVEATTLTALRTAAATSVAAKRLAARWTTALVIGVGQQAEAQARALSWAFPGVSIRCYDAHRRDPRRAASLADRLERDGLPAKAAPRLRRAVEEADLIVTATPSQTPLFPASWLQPGAHVSAVGADTRGKRELDARLLASAKLVVDDWDQSSEIGECQYGECLRNGDRPSTLGEVLAGMRPGRESSDEITVFDSTGLAIQDLVAARLALRTRGVAANRQA